MINTICIFGSSCSGKSTLAKSLENQLGKEWTYVDRDDLLDLGNSEEKANAILDERIQRQSYLIVDTQIPWRSKKKGELYCLLLPPLEIALKRDHKRTLHLKREEKRAYWARDYVIQTHRKLKSLDQTQFDICFEEQQMNVLEEVKAIKDFIHNKKNTQRKKICCCLAMLSLIIALPIILGLQYSRKDIEGV